MRKLLLISSFLYILVLTAYTQSLEISFDGNVIPNGGAVCVYTTKVDTTFAIGAAVRNKSTSNLNVKVKKIELQVVTGSENSFCWGVCEPPNVYVSSQSVPINAGNSDYTSFIGDYLSYNHSGKTRVMYVFFAALNPDDSMAIIVEYLTGSGVGISQNLIKQSTITSAFPNPAKNEFKLDYSLGNYSKASIEIRNIVGTKVKGIELTDYNGSLTIDVSELKEGVYFYTLLIDDKIMTSKRIVIQK